MIEDFWNELNEGDIHTRDSLQFELKSGYFINPLVKQNVYKQEVYMFIPNALQITSESYSKEQFYLDQTHLIRYKTPVMSLSDISNLTNPKSPLFHLRQLLEKNDPIDKISDELSDELKLFGAIFRGAVREEVFSLSKKFIHSQHLETAAANAVFLCTVISNISHQFREFKGAFNHKLNSHLKRHFKYVDEFISTAIEENLLILLKQMKSLGKELMAADQAVAQLIISEEKYRVNNHLDPKNVKGEQEKKESILYRQGLLHRFILESLMLKHVRFSSVEKHRNIIGACAAGIAMLVYMIIFVWQISTFVINSFPFIASAVLFYILKDRIKEGFKTFYQNQAHRWFPDYSTKITSFKEFDVGNLSESFAFIYPNQVPEAIKEIRNQNFHEELQALHRHETIIQYKRELVLYPPPAKIKDVRRKEVTTFFRFNIHFFLRKASNTLQSHLSLDIDSKDILETLLPKVYHLNLIIYNSFRNGNPHQKEEWKAFRVVLDKSGIKRIEQIKLKESQIIEHRTS